MTFREDASSGAATPNLPTGDAGATLLTTAEAVAGAGGSPPDHPAADAFDGQPIAEAEAAGAATPDQPTVGAAAGASSPDQPTEDVGVRPDTTTPAEAEDEVKAPLPAVPEDDVGVAAPGGVEDGAEVPPAALDAQVRIYCFHFKKKSSYSPRFCAFDIQELTRCVIGHCIIAMMPRVDNAAPAVHEDNAVSVASIAIQNGSEEPLMEPIIN